MMNIVGKRRWFFMVSGIAILASIVFLAVFGLKPGIEFSSGTSLTVSFEQPVENGALREELANLGHDNALVQSTTGGDYIIRTFELNTAEKEQLESGLSARFGSMTEKNFETIDPLIARQTSQAATTAVIVAAIGILIYIIWAFRKLPKAIYYGTSALIAVGHDVLITIGVFSLLGVILGWEINLMFITGVLAVIGYSINNIVVIFDRIRENITRGVSPDFERVANVSVVETLSRCLNTSITTLIAVLALLFFVGGSIQNFVWVLLIGVIVGTLDSIFIAPSLLVVWERGEWGKLLRSPPRAT